ncbi:MAG TPA: hypothetical protein PKD10_13005 [Paracoccaceae bacterium]|nr:hypothetical protein [Paracoccaceae bacterium]HMO72717.1 hypothetical protein [Paracoccaceae bacterium]
MGGARRSKEQVLAEFHWLYDCFDAFLAAHGPVEGIDYRELPVISRDDMLSWLETGRTPSQLVAGVRSALRDAMGAMRHLPRDNPAKGAALHASYLARRGRSLAEDIAMAREAQP